MFLDISMELRMSDKSDASNPEAPPRNQERPFIPVPEPTVPPGPPGPPGMTPPVEKWSTSDISNLERGTSATPCVEPLVHRPGLLSVQITAADQEGRPLLASGIPHSIQSHEPDGSALLLALGARLWTPLRRKAEGGGRSGATPVQLFACCHEARHRKRKRHGANRGFAWFSYRLDGLPPRWWTWTQVACANRIGI